MSTTEYTITVKVESINIRTGPGITYSTIGSVFNGDSKTCDYRQTNSDGSIWYRIKGTTYWICIYRPTVDTIYYATVSTSSTATNTSFTTGTSSSLSSKITLTYDKDTNTADISDHDIDYHYGFKTTSNITGSVARYSTLTANTPSAKDLHNLHNDAQYNIVMLRMKKDLNANVFSCHEDLIETLSKYYNLYDIPFPDYDLKRTFTRIYITRPDLNFFVENTNKLLDTIESDPTYFYINQINNQILPQLTANFSNKHDINFTLSNAAKSMDISDELIDTQEVGENVLGFKMLYGKSIHKSMTGGNINITFKDDRRLTVYNMLTAWVKYISDVYHGMHSPKDKYLKQRILDYASSLYYFVVAEDGETILFAIKYYGIFPINIPSSNFSKSEGSMIEDAKYNIQFAYSFKDPINLLSLAELNRNTICKGDDDFSSIQGTTTTYRKLYDMGLGHSGTTFVGVPFIVKEQGYRDHVNVFKLKHVLPTNSTGGTGIY